jgi:putative restriction endonuclease
MPASKKRLFDQVEQAARASGYGIVRQPSPTAFPAEFVLTRDNRTEVTLVYIWNITHGGASRGADEFRIQVTSGVTAFATKPGVKTLVLGWNEERDVFAGWDVSFHLGALGGSPSFQINRQTLDSAKALGIASYRKQTGELAIAFVSEFFGVYVDQLVELHQLGATEQETSVLDQVAENPTALSDSAIDAAVQNKPRAYALRLMRTALRDFRFRRDVLEAYGHQCAMCSVQLRLVEAAHIIPVEHPDGTDEVRNGVALCVLHHRAYDRGLIGFDEQLNIKINQTKLSVLESEGATGGLAAFTSALGKKLVVPAAANHRPLASYIAKANKIRDFPSD